jgi:succinoglycan biosynthesis transport protein ExoP
MLQTGRIRANIDDQVATEGGLEELVDFALGLLRRQFPLIFIVAFLATAIGLIYVITAPPVYTAHAKVIIDARKGQFFQHQFLLADDPVNASQIESHILILKSVNVAAAVIKKLQLIKDSELVGPGRGLVNFLLCPLCKISQSDEPQSESDLLPQAVAAFDKRLDARRVSGSNVIEIAFHSHNAAQAAQIVNAVADRYIVDQQEAKFEASQRANEWLKERLNGLREQALAADRAVVAFTKENNIVTAGGKLMDEQQLAELNSQLVAARNRTSEARARLTRIQAVIRSGNTNAPVDATVSDTLSNPIITPLRQRYLDQAGRLAEWSARYGANHQAVIQLRKQIQEIQNSIFQELQRLGETYKSNYEIAKQHEDEIEKELATVVAQSQTTNKAQVTLRELQASAQSYRTLYETFLRQHTESVERQSFPISEARVIERATKGSKSSPRTRLVLALSVLGGLTLGVGLGLLREAMDHVFRTSDQVADILQTPCIALVPLLSAVEDNHSLIDQRPVGAALRPRTIVRDSSIIWTLVDSPSSRFAEAIRAIKLAADAAELNGASKSNRVIGFTSSLPNEGKSTMAAALAQLIAQVGKRVVIVDCDLRNPRLSRALAPQSEFGIIEVISGQRSLDEAIWKEPTTNMAFLPVGIEAHRYHYHTSEILASDWTQKLFDELRLRYDYIVVDLPPLAPVVDVRATIHFVDRYFLVIEWGRTKVELVRHALNAAHGVYDNLVGVILNKTDMNSLKRYELHREKYYYNEHFSRYGYTEGVKDRWSKV